MRAGTLPRGVVFDQDGTFLDTERAWSRAEIELFRRRDLEFTDAHKRRLLGTSFEAACETLELAFARPGDGRSIMLELVDLVHRELDAGVSPMPGAVELARDLRAAGVAVGLATNSGRRFVQRAMGAAGQLGAFDVVRTSEDVAAGKPAPDLYLAAADALGLAPADCVAVEDSDAGVTSARAAGMAVVGVPSMAGVVLEAADLVVGGLDAPEVRAYLGLGA